MKIVRISGFAVKYTVRNGGFRLSGGRKFTEFPSLILRIDTDEGISGWGEHASSAQYMVALHSGAIGALSEIGPELIGADPRQLKVIHNIMDRAVKGHQYAKTAVDIACWDIAGKAAGLPIADLLGGIQQKEFPMLKMAVMDEPEIMAASCLKLADEGFRTVQIKIGNDWRTDVERVEACLEVAPKLDRLVVDANANYMPHEALSLLNALGPRDFILEQPCRTLEDNLSVRRRITQPMVLDESLDSIDAVFRAHKEDGFDLAMLKLSRFGGILPLSLVRDCCVAWNRPVTIEDMAGGGIIAAASAHLAASTPASHLAAGSFCTAYVEQTYTLGDWPQGAIGRLPSDNPGLGIDVDLEALGEPIFIYE